MALTKVPSNLDATVATTQSASDNSTNVATTAYVTTAIANLSDSAPAALNTLNEIAAALGDDANYASTTTAAIAAKLPLAGGTMTGTLNITQASTADTIKLTRTTTSQNNMIKFASDSADKWIIGQRNDSTEHFRFYSYGTSSDVLSIQTDGKVGIGTASPDSPLHVKTTDQSIQIRNTGNANVGLEIYRDSDGAKGASIAWGNGNANLEIKNYRNDGQSGGPYANIDFFTGGTDADSPDFSPTRRMRIQQTGEVGIGTDDPTKKLHIGGTAPGDSIIRQDATSSGTNWEIGERVAGKYQFWEDDGDNVRLTIMSTGNVGIGTDSPNAPLEISGGAAMSGGWGRSLVLRHNFPVMVFQSEYSTDAYGAIGYDNSTGMQFMVNSPSIDPFSSSQTPAMIILDNKNVGIGTVNPLDALHVTSAVSTDYRGNLLLSDSTAIATGVGGQLCFGGKYTGSTYTEWAGIQGTKENATDGHYGGQLEFKSRAHNGALSTKMTLDSSGRVLMGIQASTTPEEGGTNAGLEVVGSSSGRYNALRLSNSYTVSTGTASTGILFGAHTNGGRDNALIEVQNTQNGGDAIEFQIHVRDNANALQKRHVINWQGNMHTQPDSANVQHYYGNQGGFMGGNSSHNIRAAGTLFMLNAGGGSSQIVLEINGANRGSVSSSSSSGVFSDRDMKENIQDIEIGLSEVLQLRPRRFKYKTGAHETYGFIAQEVETTVPLAVDEIELPEADVEANKTTLKTLDTTSLIAALVKSIQELEARIATLEG